MSGPTSKARVRRTSLGSRMSTKQMAQTVKDGRSVTLDFGDDTTVKGYLGGMDDYYWLIVDPADAGVILVRKGAVFAVTFDQERRYDDEPNHKTMEQIIRPFREHVLATYFGRGGAVSIENED